MKIILNQSELSDDELDDALVGTDVLIALSNQESELLKSILLQSGINTKPLAEEEEALCSVLWSSLP